MARAYRRANRRNRPFVKFIRWFRRTRWAQVAASTLLIVLAFHFWTQIPTPVDAAAATQVSSAKLSPSGVWEVSQAQENSQIQLRLAIGPTRYNEASEFPTLDQQASAIAGNATCALTMTNVVGHVEVQDTLTSDFLIDAQGASFANEFTYPAASMFYSVTDNGPTGMSSTTPADIQVIVVRIDVALGSNNGANVQNYVVYLLMGIDASGRVECALGANPTVVFILLSAGK